MNLKSNLRLPVETWIFIIICAIGVYFIFDFLILPPRFTEEMGGYMVVQDPTETNMEKFKEGTDRYAMKVQENGEYYLLANGYMNGEKIVGKYTLSKEQYDFIDKSMMYWFDIKYKKANDFTLGTVKKVYDYNPW